MYVNQHRGRLKERFILPFYHLEKGMVAEMYYRKKDPQNPKFLLPPKYYIILVLQKRWPNNVNGYMHALSIEHFSPAIFDSMATEMGVKYSYYQKKLRMLDIKKLKKLEEDTSKMFYYNELKDKLENTYENSYRIFIPQHISSFRAVNYNWITPPSSQWPPYEIKK